MPGCNFFNGPLTHLTFMHFTSNSGEIQLKLSVLFEIFGGISESLATIFCIFKCRGEIELSDSNSWTDLLILL